MGLPRDCPGIAVGLPTGIVARGKEHALHAAATASESFGILSWHPGSAGGKCQAGEPWKQVGTLIP